MLIIIYIKERWIIMDRTECRKLTNAEHSADWQEKQTFVCPYCGACLLALVIAFKNILNIPGRPLHVDLIHQYLHPGESGHFVSSCHTATIEIDNQPPGSLDCSYRTHYDDYHCPACCLAPGIGVIKKTRPCTRICHVNRNESCNYP